MAKQLKPIPADGLSIPRANILIAEVGDTAFADVGDCESFSLSLEVQEVERYGKNFGTKQLRKSDVIQVDASISMELVDMTRFLRALSVAASDTGAALQTAAIGELHTVTGVEVGKVYKLPHRSVSNVAVADGTGAVDYVEGQHYVLLDETGYVQVIATPAGADTDLAVSYDAAEITADDDKLLAGIGSQWNVRRCIHVVGINKVGKRDILVLHDVQIRPEGDRAFQGGDEYATLTLTGRVFADPSQAEGFELGYLSEV